MKHVGQGTLQAFLDGELDGPERREVAEHLLRCGECRAALDAQTAAAATFSGAIGALDDAPTVGRTRPARWRLWAAMPRAAVLLLGFAAIASAAVPGSPVRAWVAALIETDTPPAAPSADVGETPAAAPVAESVTAEEPLETGVALMPVQGEVRVILVDADPGLHVRARLTDGTQAEVIATGAASRASYRMAPGRVEVVDAGAGELRIEIPRSVVHATVEIDGVRYLAKDGEQLRLLAPAAGGDGISFRIATVADSGALR